MAVIRYSFFLVSYVQTEVGYDEASTTAKEENKIEEIFSCRDDLDLHLMRV